MKQFILALSVLTTTSAFSSALLKYDEAKALITVRARMVYSGPALTPEIAQASTDEIQNMWSEIPTDVKVGNKIYRVEFDIDYITQKEIQQSLPNQESCAYNFIVVKPKTSDWDRSYYEGLGSQNGVFFTSDGLGSSTTTAHEFGHGLMLDHNPADQRTADVPGIMFARGTLVRPEYQYNPQAQAGQPGGTINPRTRKVRSIDIQTIPFPVAKELTCLGDGKILNID